MPDFLPEEYAFSHEYALFLNDTLSSMVKSGEEAGIFCTEFRIKDADHSDALAKLPDDDKWDWLEANGYGDITADVMYRQVTVALLADFCHFVFEALRTSKKGKLTVAYALMRKPFKDNLFYLEWLLADPGDFVKAFRHGGPEELEDRRKQRAKRLPIITEAIKRTREPALFDAEFIDAIRYDRNAAYGFAGTWDQANHLITTFSAIRTSQQGFNFVFSSNPPEQRWEFLYMRLPILLYYAVEVAEAVITRLLPDPAMIDDSNRQRRTFGYILCAESFGFELGEEEKAMELPGCPNCGVAVRVDMENMRYYYDNLKLKCNNCNVVIDMGDDGCEEASE